MNKSGLISELPKIGITAKEALEWRRERLKELEGIVTNIYWKEIVEKRESEAMKKTERLMERYHVTDQRKFIAIVRKFIRNSLKI